jgi:3-hydroxyisobutyrate dehydrogenase-like beta-hydroxyacid dehydrogenase
MAGERIRAFAILKTSSELRGTLARKEESMSKSSVTLSKGSAKIGFVGLGLMGSRLTRRLHGSGWNVRAWNRSPEPAEEVKRAGVPIATSLAALAYDSEVIVSCLANDAAVRSVYLDDLGVLSIANPGTIFVEMSTISAGLSQEIHRAAEKRGVRALDVAISGSAPAVEGGTITLLAGGDRNTFEQCIPLYESIAKQWFLIGPGASGVQMKLVVNLLLGVGMEALAEAISLGQHLLIDKDVLLEVLSKTAVIPPAFLGKFRKIKDGDYAPEFPFKLMSKDLNLVLEAARSSGASLPAATAAQRSFNAGVPSSGDLDVSAITPLVAARRIDP